MATESLDKAKFSDPATDAPYKFGVYTRLATIETAFNTHQVARLMVLRSRLHADSPTRPECPHATVALDADCIGFECVQCGDVVSEGEANA